ncbi:MAG: excinuclease ABC subunit UvrA, partial [Verrucomicrobiota bacterium]
MASTAGAAAPLPAACGPGGSCGSTRSIWARRALEITRHASGVQFLGLTLPLGQLIVVTGPSGSGKSSLAFQTLYAEGQRRYVETFSPYVRQFFDRMDKPQVDQIRGIPPAIALEQQNQVKTTRSTVGTITEINDYLKLLFPRLAEGVCPECGETVQPDHASSIVAAVRERFPEKSVLLTFSVDAPEHAEVSEFFTFLQGQGFLRVLLFGEVIRTDDPESYDRPSLPGRVDVIQDRVSTRRRTRLQEGIEAALRLGKGQIKVVDGETGEDAWYSTSWHCASCDVSLREPSPGMFSFNSPIGACGECRGFGRVIGIDWRKAIPNEGLSISEGAVKAFQGDTYQECQADLVRASRNRGVDIRCPFEDLPEEDRQWIIEGEGSDPDEAWEHGDWYGIKGFFQWLESKAYKMHVRVFLSRYRNYTTCRACDGGRLQPASLHFRLLGKTLPEWWQIPVDELRPLVQTLKAPKGDGTTKLLLDEIANRLSYLEYVGLGYLNLDRSTRTLSGGETQRVNLTTCLGASLTSTLFVLDEPSVGLHPRDVGRLIDVLSRLRDKGNTLVVVEHEESVIRAADYLVDVGPGRGDSGGDIVFHGPAARLAKLPKKKLSLTRDYLEGIRSIEVPPQRRKSKVRLTIKGARQHNLQKVRVNIPLQVMACVTGVSGSGKSTLVHDVLYQNLLRARGEASETEVGAVKEILGGERIRQVVMVDQAPLSRTPRSTPAVYVGVFEHIRKLFAASPDAKARGLTMGFFSFNSGAGRCERCWGMGFEKVEMQFLSDVFVRCPECEGRRYAKETLEVQLEGFSIQEVLEMTVERGVDFFGSVGTTRAAKEVVRGLTTLQEVGLGYLRLGQPLNTLSGGESQRLKLVGHLLAQSRKEGEQGETDLLIFDEPTTGLHFDDIALLLKLFHRMVDAGNSLLIIEHNIDVIRSADWVIDLGPGAGKEGGRIVAEGTPEEVAQVQGSHTGAALRGEAFREGSDGLRLREDGPVEGNVIRVEGAKEHNLKDLSLTIPRNEMVTVTGLSGSGKSTLAFDILFAEGQRRFLDSMSTYARQFVEQMEKPEVDQVRGLPPTVAIEQRISRSGGKSTVATVTEVYHFLRLLYAKTGVQYSPETGKPVQSQSVSSIVSRICDLASRGKVQVMAPLVRGRKGFHTEVAAWAERQGYERLWVDGRFQTVEGFQKLERFKEHHLDVVIGEVSRDTPLPEVRSWVDAALKYGKGTLRAVAQKKVLVFSTEMSCPETGRSFDALDPRLFSYHSPHGWCPSCRGFGEVYRTLRGGGGGSGRDGDSVLETELQEERSRDSAEEGEMETCPTCLGQRLNEVALAVRVKGRSIAEFASLTVREAHEAFAELTFDDEREAVLARDILPEICQRLRFMDEVGLGYLQLSRSAKTLSGGEAQRIRLAAQLGSNLRGVLYVLDEPTIGLHPRDNEKLLETLRALKDKGNSLLVVEHDEETMRRSDHIIDLGPGAGRFGGEITASGTLEEIMGNERSATGRHLQDPPSHPMRGKRRALPAKSSNGGWLRIRGAYANNLRKVDAQIPLERLTLLCGVSGSGKSSFLRGVLGPAVRADLKRHAVRPKQKAWKSVSGNEEIEAVYEVDQSPIGKTSRSCPATYLKIFDEIRRL